MNDDAIFFKTLAGEEAMRERTRLVQRNLRMVLIIVDGAATVADLKRKTADPTMVEGALAELEHMGLIETGEAHAARLAAAVEPAERIEPTVAAEPERRPEPAVLPESDDEDLEDVHSDFIPLESETVFDEEMAAKPRVHVVPGFVAPSHEPPPAKAVRPSPLAGVAGWWSQFKTRRAAAKEDSALEKAYGGNEAWEPEAVQKPVRRASERGPGLGRHIAVGILGLLVLTVLVLLFFPYGRYQPEIEQRLSLAFGDPVKVGNVHVTFSPYPAITVEGVSVGADPYATVDAIRVLPEPGSLLGGHRYRAVRVDGLRIKQEGLARMSRWLSPAGSQGLTARSVEFGGVVVDFGTASISGLSGSAQVDPERGLGKILLEADEGKIRAEVTPGSAGVSLVITASDWTTPFEPAVRFSSLEVRGDLAPGRFNIASLDGQAADGRVMGAAELAWGQDAVLSANLEFRRVNAGSIYPELAGIEGPASGKVRISARADRPAALAKMLRMDGSFNVVQGGLRHVDLVQAVRATGNQAPQRGGTTRFEQLSGSFAMDGASVRFTGLELSSGLLHAAGQVTVSRQDKTVAGAGRVEMRGSVGASRTGVAISGPVGNPELRVGR